MATALELSRAGWEPYIEAARSRQMRPRPAPDDSRLREQLLSRVHRVATVLKERFGARRVVLFGSLAHEGWFGPHSDVDLAIEGLASAYYWEAWRVAEDGIGDRSVDLVEIETAKPSLRRAILTHGIEV